MDLPTLIAAVGVLLAATGPLLRTQATQRRDYLQAAITPYFDALERVHLFYNELFVWAEQQFFRCEVARASPDAPPFRFNTDITALLDEFEARRRTDERYRHHLREEAQNMLSAIRWPEERRFLMTVINYFLGIGGTAPTGDDLDRQIEGILQDGGRTALDTPTVRMYFELRAMVATNTPDLPAMIARLARARGDLNQAYINVRRAYCLARDAALLAPL